MDDFIIKESVNLAAPYARRTGPKGKSYSRGSSEASVSSMPEVSNKTSSRAILLGMAIVAASIVVCKSFLFFGFFFGFSFIMTLIWKKAPRPWIFLASVSAATPFSIARQQYPCNLIYSIWFTLFNFRYLSMLPRWIYGVTGLAFFGFILSSIHWMGSSSFMRQGSYFLNFVLGPFIFIPIMYCRLGKSRDAVANLRGLLYCLIVPSTLILLAAKTFGKITNAWEASNHAGGSTEGFFVYQLVNVQINFLRTEVGFILAALICASSAAAFLELRPRYKWIARACLASNAFLLLTTASFRSSLACLCGLIAIFSAMSRKISITKLIGTIATIIFMLVVFYALSPPNIKNYLVGRFEHRVANKNTDRLDLWINGIKYYIENPTGVGFTLAAGTAVKSDGSAFVHNDYIAYTMSYSILGGFAYLAFVIGALISFVKKRGRLPDDPYALATFLAGHGVIIVIALNSMTDHMTESRWYFNLIWSIVWYSYFCSRAALENHQRVA